MIEIAQSTSRVVMLKLFTTGTTTAATGKTVAITISKAGAAFGNPNAGATNATEVSSGWYKVTMDTTDTNTLGDLVVRGTATGCDDTERIFAVSKATNRGLTALPDTAATTNASLITSGTGTDQLSVSAGKVLLQATQTGVTIPTVTTVTNQLTAAQIATGVWQDTTSGDFTVASSIGKSLYTTGNAPGAASGLALVGSNMGTVSSVTGSVGSVVGLTASNLDVASSTLATAANLATLTGYVDTEVAAIKAKTDQLTFTIANQVDSNVLTGGGSGLDAAGTRAALGLASANLDTQLSGIQSDTNDIQTRLPATLVGGRMDANAIAIASSTTAATRLAANADAIITGTATAGGASTITLEAGSSSNADLYENQVILIVSGAGAKQTRKITASSTASPPVLTVSEPWVIAVDNTSVYQILGRDG